MPEKDIFEKLKHLKEILGEMGEVLVAFSGGADSAFLLKVARIVLKEKVLAVTAVSASLAPEEKEATIALAREMDVPHLLLESHEMENPDYVKNAANRCYFCKTELYTLCVSAAAEKGFHWVADGFTADDLKDYRPGYQAKKEHDVRSPLLEAGLTKPEIRALSRELGLKTWDKPASPCLASRIPYGIPVTGEALGKIGRLESFLRAKGFREFRVRYHEKIVRLEVSSEDIARFSMPGLRDLITAKCKEEGFEFVTLDLEGFRSGRLNEGIHSTEIMV
ncbi:MAG: ATP-dependent sacrificial sulfur transferase LarE [Deltaproteobacteria bacterium]|nr:ATP-dependent sacrificial sulfur transferase LarE [Deltaproteobacteria bacterium]